MKDSELRGFVLQQLYRHRRRPSIELDDIERLFPELPEEEVIRLVYALDKKELVEIEEDDFDEAGDLTGLTFSISPDGVDVVEGNAPTPIAISINGENVMVGSYNQQRIDTK